MATTNEFSAGLFSGARENQVDFPQPNQPASPAENSRHFDKRHRPALRSQAAGNQYWFGQFFLASDGTLLRDSLPVPIPPKELAVLRLLLANAGQVVSAQQLRDTVWSSVNVSAESVPRCISSLRTRLGSDECIQTLYKRGYRFQLPVNQMTVERWIERRVTPRSGAPRLAILPFSAGSGVPTSYGPGIAEETMLRLSRTAAASFSVLARESVFACHAASNNAAEAGSRLEADLVVSGSVTALPEHFRLRAEMMRVADSTQLWMEDFLLPRPMLEFADARMAKRIAARIRNTFVPPVSALPSAAWHSEQNLSLPAGAGNARAGEAYAAYMQARFQWNTLERHQMLDAIRGLQRAVELDPALLSPRVHLVHGYLSLASFGFLPPDDAAEISVKEALKILDIAPRCVSIHPALGWINFFYRRDTAAAAQQFARPESSAYNAWSSNHRIRYATGRRQYAEALELLGAGLIADPFLPSLHGRLAWTLHLNGEGAAALRQAHHALTQFPNHPLVVALCVPVLSFDSAGGGEAAQQAVAHARRLTQTAPSLDAAHATLAYACARNQEPDEARAILDRLLWLGSERHLMRSFLVPALVELGDLNTALDQLSKAEQERCPWFFEIVADPRLEPLRGLPEFRQLDAVSRQMEADAVSVA